MRCYILKITTRGIKNIEKNISINFYPQTISKKINPRNTNVKAIYGMNGSGKSAIIKSIEMYKYLVTMKNYLSSTPKGYFDNLINKKDKSFYFDVVYAVYDEKYDNKVLGIFNHSLLAKEDNGSYKLVEEKLSKLAKNGRTINDKFELLYEVINGELYINQNSFGQHIKNKSLNLLNESTLISFLHVIYIDYYQSIKLENGISDFEFTESILQGGLLRLFLNIYIKKEDRYDDENIYNYETLKLLNFMGINDSGLNRMIDINLTVVKKEYQESYEKEIKKLEKFIKIFKPELKEITYTKRINKESYLYNLIFNYENYSIDLEFESTGIKKLKNLYQYLQYAAQGGIVFIDELDANLHDVYLSKLIEFFENYGLGQLCFTTHNLATMNELKEYKNSIDFITENTEITSWKKNGHYNPFSQYRSGMIKGAPFNIEDFDFLTVFGDGED